MTSFQLFGHIFKSSYHLLKILAYSYKHDEVFDEFSILQHLMFILFFVYFAPVSRFCVNISDVVWSSKLFVVCSIHTESLHLFLFFPLRFCCKNVEMLMVAKATFFYFCLPPIFLCGFLQGCGLFFFLALRFHWRIICILMMTLGFFFSFCSAPNALQSPKPFHYSLPGQQFPFT